MTTPNIRELRRQRARQQARWPLGIRLLVALAGLYLVYLLVGFFIAPSIIKAKLEARLSEQLKREVTIEHVGFNPAVLSLRVDKLRVKDHDGQLLLGWGRLFVNFQLFSLIADEIHFSEIELDGFAARIDVSKQGILNVADITAPPSSSSSKKNWTLRIDRLAVNRAELDYADESRPEPFRTHVGPTTFVLRDFRTAGSEGAPGVFTASTESGERIEWTGRLALAPLRSTGELRLGQLALKKYAPYYATLVPFDVLDGTIDVQAPYEFLVQNNKPQLKLSEAAVKVRGLQLGEKGKTDPALTLKTVEVEPISADLQAGTIEVTRVALEGGSAAIVRDASGINLQRLFTSAKTTASSTPAAHAADWVVRVNEVSAKNFSANVTDRTTPRPGEISLNGIALTARHLVSNNLAAAVPIELRAEVGTGGGTLSATGTASLQPLKADLQVAVEGVALAPASPWAETFVNARITQGLANLHGQAHLAPQADGALAINGAGDLDLDLLSVTDANGGAVLQWKSLAIHGVNYTSNPDRLTIAEISLADPQVRIARAANQTLNVSTLLRQAPAAPPPTAIAAGLPVTNRFMAIDRVALANGSIQFTDDSVQPEVKTVVSQLSGAITGLTSAAIDRADVQLNGFVNASAPLAVTGKANLLSNELAADLKLELKNTDLLPLAPYIGKFVGYQLTSGGVSIDGRAKLANRRLDSSSNVVVTNFVLGPATNSPDAPHVPIHLALALLRDSEGKIVLELPVQGSLDDPSFQISAVVMQVVKNLIVKAATSPFTLIGSIFGGGRSGEDLSFVTFAAGGSDVPATEQSKLDVVAKALHERPGLRMLVTGSADPAQDATVLRDQELQRRIHAVLTDPTRVIAGPINPNMQIGTPLDPEAQAIATLYQKEFAPPPLIEKPAAPAQTEPTHHRFFLFRWFSRSKPEPAPAPKPAPRPVAPVAPSVLPSVDEMRAQLLQRIQIGDEALAQLSAERAKQVRLYLIAKGPVDPDRIDAQGGNPNAKPSTRVTLQFQ